MLEGFVASKILACVAVIAVSGVVLTTASLRAIANYDKD